MRTKMRTHAYDVVDCVRIVRITVRLLSEDKNASGFTLMLFRYCFDIYLANYGAGSRGSSPLVAACRRTGLCARMSVRICVRCVRMRTRRTHDTVGSNT